MVDSDIDDTAVEKAEYYLRVLRKIDLEKNTRRPITIVIRSYGGSIYDGLSLIGLMKTMIDDGYEIITEVSGYAMSMGGLISVVGSKRRISRYGTVLIHQPSSGARGTLNDIKAVGKEVERLWSVSKQIIKEHSNVTDEYLDEIYEYKIDKFISPEECLELGLVDEII